MRLRREAKRSTKVGCDGGAGGKTPAVEWGGWARRLDEWRASVQRRQGRQGQWGPAGCGLWQLVAQATEATDEATTCSLQTDGASLTGYVHQLQPPTSRLPFPEQPQLDFSNLRHARGASCYSPLSLHASNPWSTNTVIIITKTSPHPVSAPHWTSFQN